MENVSPTTRQQDRAARIAAELASLCLADPPVLHGPYWQWTRKVAGKTITRLVPDEQLDDYQQWLDNHRRLRALVAELEALTLAIADADPRGKRRPAGSAHNTRQTAT